MEGNKSLKGLYALITILIMLVLGLGGFIVYKEFIGKDTTNSTPNKVVDQDDNTEPTNSSKIETDTVKEISVDSEIVKKLFSAFHDFTNHPSQLPYYGTDKVVSKDVPSQTKLEIVSKQLKEKIDLNNGTISREDFNKELIRNFGSIDGFEFKSYDEVLTVWCSVSFDDNNVYFKHIDGLDSGTYEVVNKVIKAEQDSSQVYIYEKLGFLNYYSSSSGSLLFSLYRDVSRSDLIDRDLVINNDNNLRDVYNKYSDKFDTFKYTFKSNGDGTYHFVSIEKVK